MFESFFEIMVAPRENWHPIKVYQSPYVLAIISVISTWLAYNSLTPYSNAACTLSIPIFIAKANHMYAMRTYFLGNGPSLMYFRQTFLSILPKVLLNSSNCKSRRNPKAEDTPRKLCGSHCLSIILGGEHTGWLLNFSPFHKNRTY